MDRFYFEILKDNLEKNDQMAFIAGPRLVGKTTLVKELLKSSPGNIYLNWDIPEDRNKILSFFEKSTPFLNLEIKTPNRPIVAFDGIHKFKYWKNFLKGFYDLYKDDLKIIVTGSAKLNIYKKGGDSLMGRYFLYRMHPLTVSEIQVRDTNFEILKSSNPFSSEEMNRLLEFGGFPAPYIRANRQFFNQWQKLRKEQFFKEDIRELSRIYDIAQMEVMAMILTEQIGQLLNYSNIANKVQIAVNTARKWINILEQMYFCFRIKPWHKNVSRSLIKEPKIYLWDWSIVKDKGARIENMVASHLLKAIHFWVDNGLGEFDLFFLRDKEKREVDFLVTKDQKPWILIESKTSSKEPLSPNLKHFQEQIHAEYAFQIAFDLDYVDFSIKELKRPMIIPMSTFLSQLI